MAVFDYPNSTLAEAYRLVRSKMEFFVKDATSPGKTFTAIKWHQCIVCWGKKLFWLVSDLSKPKIYMDFNLNNEKGVSTFLIGKDRFEDIEQETPFKEIFQLFLLGLFLQIHRSLLLWKKPESYSAY